MAAFDQTNEIMYNDLDANNGNLLYKPSSVGSPGRSRTPPSWVIVAAFRTRLIRPSIQGYMGSPVRDDVLFTTVVSRARLLRAGVSVAREDSPDGPPGRFGYLGLFATERLAQRKWRLPTIKSLSSNQ